MGVGSSFYHVGPGNQAQVTGVGSKRLSPLSHLADPGGFCASSQSQTHLLVKLLPLMTDSPARAVKEQVELRPHLNMFSSGQNAVLEASVLGYSLVPALTSYRSGARCFLFLLLCGLSIQPQDRTK